MRWFFLPNDALLCLQHLSLTPPPPLLSYFQFVDREYNSFKMLSIYTSSLFYGYRHVSTVKDFDILLCLTRFFLSPGLVGRWNHSLNSIKKWLSMPLSSNEVDWHVFYCISTCVSNRITPPPPSLSLLITFAGKCKQLQIKGSCIIST